MFLSQQKYAQEILELANMINYKPINTSDKTLSKVDGMVLLMMDLLICNRLASAL